MSIIRDKRIINAICRQEGLKRDDTYCYIVDSNNKRTCDNIIYKGKTYHLQYISGCFYPYLVEGEA